MLWSSLTKRALLGPKMSVLLGHDEIHQPSLGTHALIEHTETYPGAIRISHQGEIPKEEILWDEHLKDKGNLKKHKSTSSIQKVYYIYIYTDYLFFCTEAIKRPEHK